jgi:hypothetical protein
VPALDAQGLDVAAGGFYGKPGIGRIALLSPRRAPGIEAREFVPALLFCGWPGRDGAGCGS